MNLDFFHKKLIKRRKNLKKNYQIAKDIPTFLSAMGSNLISSDLAAGNTTDRLESQNPNSASNDGGNESAWRVIADSDDDDTDNDINPGENPYAGRRIGRRPQEAVNAGRHKCPICAKGFNSRSTFISCHLCDKPTHLRCIKETFNEEQFFCQKCEQCPEPKSSLLKRPEKCRYINIWLET